MEVKSRRDDELSREELLAELQRLRERSREAELERLFHDLQVNHEEVLLQQSQLIDAQRALEEARDRYTELFDFSPIAYVVLDTNGVIREANLCTTRLLGRERARLIGTPLFLYVAAEDRRTVLDHLGRCRAGNPRVETDVRFNASAGAAVPTQITSAPAASAHGQPTLLLTAIVDLSERRRIEQERARQRDEQERLLHEEQIARAASDAKDRFLAILSHELRTPLTPILFALDAVKDRDALPDWLRPTFDLIRRNILFETRLIDDLLDVTRIVQGKMSLTAEVVDAHELIGDVVALCRDEVRTAQIQVSVETTAHAYHVNADPVRLRQVVWNLLRNAIRNTPASGRVIVRSANRTPAWLTLSVSDTGRGIDPDMLPRIFTLFEQDDEAQRRGVGLGLGLAISKGIVEAVVTHFGSPDPLVLSRALWHHIAMTKHPRKGKVVRFRQRQRDVNQLARAVVNRTLDVTEGKDPAAVALGRRGGLKGGKARMADLTAEERHALAVKAAQARWGNK